MFSVPNVIQNVPWARTVVVRIPYVGEDTKAFGRFAVEQSKKRYTLSESITRKDLAYYLASDCTICILARMINSSLRQQLEHVTDPAMKLPKIVFNSVLAIIAGSDTTSSCLSNIIYYLLRHPSYMNRLRAELDQAFPPSDNNETITLHVLTSLPMLNAVM